MDHTIVGRGDDEISFSGDTEEIIALAKRDAIPFLYLRDVMQGDKKNIMAIVTAFFIIAVVTGITFKLLHDRKEDYRRGGIRRGERGVSIPYEKSSTVDTTKPIVGKWQLIKGRAVGTIIEVVELNGKNQFIGRVIRVPGNHKRYFKRGEIVWQRVVPVGRNRWMGIVIGKRPGGFLNRGEGSMVTREGFFTLISADSLEISIGKTESRWMRLQ